MTNQGKIIIHNGVHPWPHEIKTAEALSENGYTIVFISKSEIEHEKTADVFLDGIAYEMKSPTSSRLSAIERNIKKAMSQSMNIIFDSKRMKNVKDSQVLYELKKQLSNNRKIESLLFVDKKRRVHKLK